MLTLANPERRMSHPCQDDGKGRTNRGLERPDDDGVRRAMPLSPKTRTPRVPFAGRSLNGINVAPYFWQ